MMVAVIPTIRTTIAMTKTSDLLKLMSWLSPVFPTGGFSYSSGLEAAVDKGLVSNAEQLQGWLASSLAHGNFHNDAIFLAEAWRSATEPNLLHKITNLALALAGSAERYQESTAQGQAFVKAMGSWCETASLGLPSPCPLTVAVGAATGIAKIDFSSSISAYLHSAVTNQVQAAIRLSVLGQLQAADVMAQIEPAIEVLVEQAEISDLDDLGSATFTADIMAMKHEHMNGRMFRS